MSAKYDPERLITDVTNLIRDNLNTKVAEIQAEKDLLLGADNFELPLVDDEAYFDSLDEGVTNFNPFIYIGMDSNSAVSSGGAGTIQELAIFVTIFIVKDNADAKINMKVFRYTRAFMEIIEKNFGKITYTSSMKISTIAPQDMASDENEDIHKAGGIVISAVMG